MKEESYRLAHAFFEAVSAGELPDELLTADMTAWNTMGGTTDKAGYQHAIHMLGAMCATPLRFTIDSLTADEDRVVAEAVSVGELINGEEYRNTYVFVIRIRDGLIASVAEHFNPLLAQKDLIPLIRQAEANITQ